MVDLEYEFIIKPLLGTANLSFSSTESTSSLSSFSADEDVERRVHPKNENFVENVVTAYDNKQFKSHFRMSRITAYELIGRFEESNFSPKYPSGRPNISSEKSFLLTVWYLANRNSFREVADRFGVTISSAHNCLTRVINFICSLKKEIIKWPDLQRKQVITNAFRQNNGIPGAIGAIDGSHIEILKPRENQDSYINRKGYHSLLLQGVVDHEKRFIDVFCGEPGSLHDARLFRRSALYAKILQNPEFIGDNFLLADSAYPNLHWIVTPFKNTGFLSQQQLVFNKRLSSKRVIVENAYGLLKGRFRRIRDLENLDLELCSKIILASCILHNVCLDEANSLEDIEEVDYNQPIAELFQRQGHINVDNHSRQLQAFNKMFV